MKVVFLSTNPDGTQREVFTVHLRGGVLVVTGNTDAARSIGVPTEPLRHLAPPVDPGAKPERYLRSLPAAYSGSMLRAQLID